MPNTAKHMNKLRMWTLLRCILFVALSLVVTFECLMIKTENSFNGFSYTKQKQRRNVQIVKIPLNLALNLTHVLSTPMIKLNFSAWNWSTLFKCKT